MKMKRKGVVHQKSSSADDAFGNNSEENIAADSGEGSLSSGGEFYNVDYVVDDPNKLGEYEVKWEVRFRRKYLGKGKWVTPKSTR
jgi:hypothetical protein